MLWVVLVIAVLSLCYWLLKKPHSYWIKRGVAQGNPTFLFGDVWGMLRRKCSIPELNQKMYNTVPDSRYCGIYLFLQPHLLVRDPDILKNIMVKDFDHFLDHNNLIPVDCDPLLYQTLVGMTGHDWREMRSAISPTFTSSKMKFMFALMSKRAEIFVNHFLKKNEKVIKIDMKPTVTRFSTDVIASTVFGFECDSLENPENDFFTMAQEAIDFTSYRVMLVFFLYKLIPSVLKFFGIYFFSDKTRNFFYKVVKENIKSREENQIVRPDMISLLLEVRKNKLKHDVSSIPDTGFATVEESEVGKNEQLSQGLKITDELITTQAFTFFFAGFDFISSLVGFMSHELAVNPDVQERLIKEVDDTKEKCNGKITYESIMAMKYLDMVVSETLRKYPTAIAGDRLCTKPYTIDPKTPEEKPLHLEKGDVILVPIYAIHRDPKYYPDPERFDPERFNEENRAKIKPCTFMPFGAGPRSCIGSRYVLLVSKVLFYHLLSNFELIPVEKTQIPLKFSSKAGNMAPETGFWLGLQRRV